MINHKHILIALLLSNVCISTMAPFSGLNKNTYEEKIDLTSQDDQDQIHKSPEKAWYCRTRGSLNHMAVLMVITAGMGYLTWYMYKNNWFQNLDLSFLLEYPHPSLADIRNQYGHKN